MPDVLVLEGVSGPALEALSHELTVAAAERVDDVDGLETVRALIVRNQTRVDAQLLARLPRLRVVARAGVGLDNVDLTAAATAGVAVTYAPGESDVSTAEHTLALALAASRRIPALDRDIRAGGWDRAPGRELAGNTWGVIGYGRIGQRTAALARAVGMHVLAHDALPDRERADRGGVQLVGLETLLERSLIVSVHVPLTPGTHGLIGAAELALMRQDAILVNTSRGGIVDEPALVEALRSGAIAGAALDVREHEPPGAPDPLVTLDQVVLTPHVAAMTAEAQERVIERIVRDVRAVLAGDETAAPVPSS